MAAAAAAAAEEGPEEAAAVPAFSRAVALVSRDGPRESGVARARRGVAALGLLGGGVLRGVAVPLP